MLFRQCSYKQIFWQVLLAKREATDHTFFGVYAYVDVI